MSLLFKMQKSLITFSRALTLEVRIFDTWCSNFRETRKDAWYHKNFEELGEIRKTKIHMWTVWFTYMFTGLEHEKMIKYKCLNEMKCQIYNVLHLVLLVKMKNIIPKKIYLTVGIWKTWYYKKLLSNRK